MTRLGSRASVRIMKEATLYLKPAVLRPGWEDADAAPFDPEAEALIRIEVEGLGSFRLSVTAQPAHHNAPDVPADCLIVTAWRLTPDGAGDTDPDEGILPLFVEEGDEEEGEEDEEDEEGAEGDGEGGEEGLVAGPAPGEEDADAPNDDEEEEEEYPSMVPDDVVELGSPPDTIWIFEPVVGFLVDHPGGQGTYCPVCAVAGPTEGAAGAPCAVCAVRGGPPADPYAALRGKK